MPKFISLGTLQFRLSEPISIKIGLMIGFRQPFALDRALLDTGYCFRRIEILGADGLAIKNAVATKNPDVAGNSGESFLFGIVPRVFYES